MVGDRGRSEAELTPLPRYHLAFFGLVFLFIVLGVLLTIDEVFPDYRGPQGAYAERLRAQLREKGPEAPAPVRFDRGVQQVLLEGYTRADRCVTCHLGVEEPAFEGAAQPLTTHPGRLLESHPPQTFGCVYCHDGEGTATSYERAAHEPRKHISDPVLPTALLEARCGTCHLGLEVPEAPRLTQGRKLLVDRQCAGCHEIPGPMGLPPRRLPLDGIGVKVSAAWLDGWLADPATYLPRHRMPHFLLSDEDRKALVAFLSSRTDPRVPVPLLEEEGDSEVGGVLFRESRCISCHPVEGRGGTLAPDLGKIGSKTSARWLSAYLLDPAAMHHETLMPRFNFAKSEIVDLVAYLAEELLDLDEPDDWVAGGLSPGSPPADEALAERGRALFVERGCMGCHSLAGEEDPGRIGPELVDMGSRPFDKFPFPAGYSGPRTRAAWLARKMETPELGLEGDALMPRIRLFPEERSAISIALLSIRTDPPPVELRDTAGSAVAFDPQGEFGRVIERYRCFSCHRMRGRGGNISQAPLDHEGSLARREWLFSYLKVPYTIRPMVPDRMPRFRMTDAEARTLTEFLSNVMVDDTVLEPHLAGPPDEEMQLRGEEVYTRLGCSACHIRAGRGGYVGPRLDGVGARLTTAWIRSFLKRPQRYKPDAVMPDYGLEGEDLDALTALLSTLKDVGFGHTPMAALGVAELRIGAPPSSPERVALAVALSDPVEKALGIPVRSDPSPSLKAFLSALRREEVDVLLADPLQAATAAAAAGYQPLAIIDGPPTAFVILGVSGGEAFPEEPGPITLVSSSDLANALLGDPDIPSSGTDPLSGRDLIVLGSPIEAVRAVLAGEAVHCLLREGDLGALEDPIRRRLAVATRFTVRPRTVLMVRGTTPYRLASRERRVLLSLFGPGEGERPALEYSPARDASDGDLSQARALLLRLRPASGRADPTLVWR